MMDFVLETGGRVTATDALMVKTRRKFLLWNHLSSVAQGTIEAMLKEFGLQYWNDGESDDWPSYAAYDDLAPETLERIVADCDAFETNWKIVGDISQSVQGGRDFWRLRQSGMLAKYPPLCLIISEHQVRIV